MSPTVPAVLDGRTVHHRRGPIEHRFSYRYRPWLVDIDRLPRLCIAQDAHARIFQQTHPDTGSAEQARCVIIQAKLNAKEE